MVNPCHFTDTTLQVHVLLNDRPAVVGWRNSASRSWASG